MPRLSRKRAREVRALIAERGQCPGPCGEPVIKVDGEYVTRFSKEPITCAHVIARARGGSNRIENLIPMCRACNLLQGTRPLVEFLANPGRAKKVTLRKVPGGKKVETGAKRQQLIAEGRIVPAWKKDPDAFLSDVALLARARSRRRHNGEGEEGK